MSLTFSGVRSGERSAYACLTQAVAALRQVDVSHILWSEIWREISIRLSHTDICSIETRRCLSYSLKQDLERSQHMPVSHRQLQH